ncbi:MAG: cell division topological specificity factor MinE [Chloroflexota bacterium]|nr:cell division topological specificity factor MinE [Chloroflexota bacterium]
MGNFFDRLIGRKPKSANRAKERLQLVLIHDRINLTSAVLEIMKDEIIDVISHHVAIDSSAVKINIDKDGRQQRLIADIPILGSKGRRRR